MSFMPIISPNTGVALPRQPATGEFTQTDSHTYWASVSDLTANVWMDGVQVYVSDFNDTTFVNGDWTYFRGTLLSTVSTTKYYGFYRLYTGATAFTALYTPWTARSSATTSNRNKGVAYSPSLDLFVAVGDAFNLTSKVQTSTNGTTWTSRTPAGTTADNWRYVIWVPALALFVAVGNNSTVGAVMTSPNGTTWTLRTFGQTGVWRDLAWSPSLGLLVAISESGHTGTAGIATSPDGITWTARTAPASGASWRGITWGRDRFIVVASTTNTMGYSTDGITWALVAAPPSNGSGYARVRFGGGMFLALGQSSGSFRSLDGITWTNASGTPPTSLGTLGDLQYYDGVFMTMPNSGTTVGVSFDLGNTWTGRTSTTAPTLNWQTICQGKGQVVGAGGHTSTAASMQSAAGVVQTIPNPNNNPKRDRFAAETWVAGTNTTISFVGNNLRITAVGANNPRAWKVIPGLTIGVNYTFTSALNGDLGGATTTFFRVSPTTDTNLATGVDVNQSYGDDGNWPGTFAFTASSTTLLIGFVPVCSADGQWVEVLNIGCTLKRT